MASNTCNAIFSSILIILAILFIQSSAVHTHNNTYTSAFDFIKHLQGCHKGLNVSGLNELKKYLHQFGYLRYVDGHDEFNNDLESAIKTYQTHFNLNVTGTLTAETASQMMVPRCGMPDIIDGQTSMGPTHDHHNRKLLYSFFPNRNKWPGSSPRLTYSFLNNGNNAAFTSLINRAVNRWVASTGKFAFTRGTDGANTNIKIGFFTGNHGDGSPFDGPSGTLAHAFAPTNGRLHFDGSEPFNYGSNPSINQIHLESVAVHEMGHILGLGHSSDPNAIMYPSIQLGEVKFIRLDDVNGILALYGS